MLLAFLLAFGAHGQETCRPRMAEAMERAQARCGSGVFGQCKNIINLTALVVAEGKVRTPDAVLQTVTDHFVNYQGRYTADLREGVALLMSELGMLEKPATSP